MAIQTNPFKVPIKRAGKIPGPEIIPWFWSPSNVSAIFAPEEFRKRLKAEMGDELDITWTPIDERWLVFARAPRVQHKLCQGWRLLFVHQGPDGEYLPL